jgi:hypothetical protein
MTPTVGHVNRATTTPVPVGRAGAAATKVSMLPPASVFALPADPMEMLHALTVRQHEADTKTQTGRVEMTKKERQEALKKLENALEEARKAREESSIWDDICGFFTKLAKVVAAVAAVASAVMTGGASAPAVVALVSTGMSTLATLNKELGLIKGDFGDALNMGLSIGGAGLGLASAGLGLASAAADSGKAATEVGRIGQYVKTGGDITAGVSQAGAAVTKAVSTAYAHEEEKHTIEAEAQAARGRALERSMKKQIEDVREICTRYRREVEVLLSTMGEQQRQHAALTGGIRG